MVRLNHTYVIVHWQQGRMPRSSGHTQTEPSAQEPLRGRDQCNQRSQLLCFIVFLIHGPFFAQKRSACSLELFCEFRSERGAELHAASLLVAGGFGWRNLALLVERAGLSWSVMVIIKKRFFIRTPEAQMGGSSS
jgi:hypothetical protein